MLLYSHFVLNLKVFLSLPTHYRSKFHFLTLVGFIFSSAFTLLSVCPNWAILYSTLDRCRFLPKVCVTDSLSESCYGSFLRITGSPRMWITPMSWMSEKPLADSMKWCYNDRDGHTKTFTPITIRFHKAFSQVVALQVIKKLLYNHWRQNLCRHNLDWDRTRSDCCLAISFAWGAMLWHGDRTMRCHGLPGAFWGECQIKGKVHLLSGRINPNWKGLHRPWEIGVGKHQTLLCFDIHRQALPHTYWH